MKKNYLFFAVAAAAILSGFGFRWIKRSSGAAESPVDQTAAIVKATETFLNMLDTAQRAKVSFQFERPKTATAAKFARTMQPGGPGGPGGGQFPGFVGEQYGKAVWSNYPVSDVPRPGVRMGSLTAPQRQAAMEMLRKLLSGKGYEKVQEIMGSDQVLADSGQHFVSGKDAYTLAIFGTPNRATPWMVEFGGHHLALNIVIAGSKGALTPTLTGAQPAVYQADGKTIRVLAAENDKAFDLLGTFDNSQRKKALLTYEIGDLVLGPGHDGEVIVPEGLKGSDMTPEQKDMLIDLISQWAGIINDAYVAARMEEIKAGIDETYFAWSGPTTHQPGRNGSSYYRIQGPRVCFLFRPVHTG